MLSKFTNAIAGLAVLTPAWLPTLQDVSTNAALWLPIVGLVYLVVQFARYLYKESK